MDVFTPQYGNQEELWSFFPSAVGMEAVVSLWKGVLQRLDVGSHKKHAESGFYSD